MPHNGSRKSKKKKPNNHKNKKRGKNIQGINKTIDRKDTTSETSTTNHSNTKGNNLLPEMNQKAKKESPKLTITNYVKWIFPYTYYIVAVVTTISIRLFFNSIMKIAVKSSVYLLPGLNSQIVQNNETIEKYILPYAFAISITISVLIIMLLMFAVSLYCFHKKYIVPFLDITCIILACIIALSAVYTYGYLAFPEIYTIKPAIFLDVIDEASGKNDIDNHSLELETSLKESNEPSRHEMTDKITSDNIANLDKSESAITYDYITDVNGEKKDRPLIASKVNNTVCLIFAYAAALLVPFNWYKDKTHTSDKERTVKH